MVALGLPHQSHPPMKHPPNGSVFLQIPYSTMVSGVKKVFGPSADGIQKKKHPMKCHGKIPRFSWKNPQMFRRIPIFPGFTWGFYPFSVPGWDLPPSHGPMWLKDFTVAARHLSSVKGFFLRYGWYILYIINPYWYTGIPYMIPIVYFWDIWRQYGWYQYTINPYKSMMDGYYEIIINHLFIRWCQIIYTQAIFKTGLWLKGNLRAYKKP